MTPARRRMLFERLKAQNPHPRSELDYRNPFELLVAVVLSAQSTDKGVNRVTPALFAEAPTPAAMSALGTSRIEKLIGSLGLFRMKAKSLVGLGTQLVERFGGKVPEDRASLESLPGVGRKTANVVLNTAFGQPTIAVDTHIFRVANRTGLAPGKDVAAVERALEANVPKPFLMDAHHWLILHGRYVCTARAPHCGTCVIADLCEYPDKNLPVPVRKRSGTRPPLPGERAAAGPARSRRAPARRSPRSS